ncbi:MAG: chloride channel protein [Lachnospiraceae bacterium]|nr:chloride channel protein [Lachnospiraceae bacterium]MDD7377507.1 chloride channel protein [Lachnospiraceae bacterium]MDY4617205.1 chloride channel protein [Lachnospiraceae bacterium]
MEKTKFSNKWKLILFCGILGTVSGAVLWFFLKLIQLGSEFLWKKLPEAIHTPMWYPIAVCVVGGAIIGIFRKLFGDYPQSMETVIGTVKKTGTYPYRKIVVLLVAAILPLILGSSVGPEAGMVGVIVALGCWVNDNLKFAKENEAYYSNVGVAVSLSVLFYSPLFGFFSAVENEDETPAVDRGKTDQSFKLLVYGVSIVSSLGIFSLFNHLFGTVSEGFPSFQGTQPNRWDLAMMIVYLIGGILLGLFFEKTEEWFEKLAGIIPPILSELLAGLILGCVFTVLPVVQFSGESQMAVLITDYTKYAPVAMMGIAFLKILITNLCIQMGLKGGHFFPVIFAAVCLGYGISLLVFPMDAAHATFAAAITTAATLGVSMKKPLAVTCLLFLCFPVRMGLWIFLAAILAGQIGKWCKNHEETAQ